MSMLSKNTDLLIDSNNPFKNDCLSREQSILDLTNLVQNTTQPFVLSVEAPWGWGKTTFIRFWKAHLELQKHPCLYFNAWSNDFVEDPLIAFISEMDQLLEKQKDENKNKVLDEVWDKAKAVGGGLLRNGLPVAARLLTQGLIDQQTAEAIFKGAGSEVGELVGKLAEERIAAYEKEKRGIEAFRNNLGEFARLLTKTDGQKGPVVFFIDELDRCRPSFAIALLERIKHLFNVEGVVFVLSIDRDQLVGSVKALYGDSIDADGYLRRFIDLRYRLLEPSLENFCDTLSQRFQIHQYFLGRNDPQECKSLVRTFKELADHFNLSLRVTEQCFTEINIVLKTTSKEKIISVDLLTFLIAVKSFKPGLYDQLHHLDNLESILDSVTALLEGNDNLEQLLEPYIAAYILAEFYDEDEKVASVKKNLNDLATNASADQKAKKVRRAQSILHINRGNDFYFRRRILSYMLSRIDNLGHFI